MSAYPQARATFECPRRMDMTVTLASFGGKPVSRELYAQACEVGFTEGSKDEWRKRDGELHCSHCGSLHPDTFMERVRTGSEVGPTDKSYKLYLYPSHDKFYVAHLTREQAGEFRQLYESGAMKVGYPGHFYHGVYLHPPREDREATA